MEHFIAIEDESQWLSFVALNADALADAGTVEECRALALRGELMLGGGAGALFRVGFTSIKRANELTTQEWIAEGHARLTELRAALAANRHPWQRSTLREDIRIRERAVAAMEAELVA